MIHLNICLNDDLGTQITSRANQLGQTYDTLIGQILTDWLQHSGQSPLWPAEVLTFNGIEDFEAFESHRQELLQPTEESLV